MKRNNYYKNKNCKDCGKLISDNAKRCRLCEMICRNYIGKRNPSFGKKRPDLIRRNKLRKKSRPRCIDCNKKLKTLNSKRCYICSNKYTSKFRNYKGKNNPMFGKVTHGKWGTYKSIKMRSSWEIIYAKWLDKNNIRWKYEPKTFNLGTITYTPDFYLPKTDEYIEIKGYWRKDAKEKYRFFRIKYQNIKIRVLNEEILKSMEILK